MPTSISKYTQKQITWHSKPLALTMSVLCLSSARKSRPTDLGLFMREQGYWIRSRQKRHLATSQYALCRRGKSAISWQLFSLVLKTLLCLWLHLEQFNAGDILNPAQVGCVCVCVLLLYLFAFFLSLGQAQRSVCVEANGDYMKLPYTEHG